MKPIVFILLLSLLGVTNAQQGNHLVVQGFDEQINNITVPFIEARNKTVYYDIDFNNYEIEINTIKCPSIKYNYYGNPPTASRIKISSGYQSISNAKGELLGFVFNNILYSKNGDSIDYIPQYGGRRGVASYVGVSDTFTLYFIRGKKDYNATSFERQLYKSINQPYPPYPVDSFFLMESKYCGSKLISKNRIKGFKSLGKYTNLQSNVVFFNTKFNERKVQFVWDKFLYEVNISNDYSINIKQVLFNNAIDRNYFIWFDYQGGMSTPCELVVSPSGRWTVFNWYYSHFVNNTYKYSNSKVLIIDNENNLKFNEIVNDSGNNNTDKITYWKNAVFTKNDSICLVRQIELNPQIGSTSYRDIVKILEVKIHENYNEKQYYNIKLDSVYTGSIFNYAFDPISDLMLAPNGKNYSFISKYILKKSADVDSLLFVQFEIAEFIKNGTDYLMNSPLLVLEGINMDYFRSYPFSNFDKIYFPATPIPYHYINFTNKSLCNDLTYEFTNETDTNWFDHFMWYWGDGDSSASHKSQTVIRHQYKKPGKYRVLLKSITAAGGWVWYSDSVEILPEPIAKYHTENTVGCQWIAVEFADSSILENKAHTWSWDFGDGSDTLLSSNSSIMPTNRSIKHTYITSGQFKVQLRVSDGRCTDTFSTTQNIEILPAPRPGIVIDITEGCTPLEVEFGRAYTDPTDSTIYNFKPILRPQNTFTQAQNKATMLDAGKFTLYQKLYGPSGCVTQDSVEILVRQGVSVDYKPELKRSTVVTNESVLTEWKSVPHASKYQLYRNSLPHAVVNDTQFFDNLSTEIDQPYTYEVQAMDSCDRRVANKSNVGKTIFLGVKEIEPASKSEFATALLTWSPYEDWAADGGVGEYESYGNYRVESESWERLSKNQDTTVNDNDFIKPKNYEKCYYVKARSAQGRYESKSNVSCLKYQATLFAPNAFTPNGDGMNDVFEVFNYGFDRFTLSIYNSWGQKIYEQNNTEGIWAPTESVPQGVYLYTIKAYRNNQEYEFSSTVTLLR
ncbi:MAG: gliding motility-associated C-terminal domain-containing protein [Bacteroidia bacterium]|nr:gliding motility-associated C-terminal domain-containing protein [Bacteroidia bacterium]